MDIGGFAAEALELLPVPFLALEAVSGASSQRDLRVVWANPSARERFGPGVEGAWLDRDQPLGVMESIVAEVERSRRTPRLSVIQRSVEREAAVSHVRCTVLPIETGSAVIVEDVTAEVEARAELAGVGSALERVERWGNLGVWEVDLQAGTVYWSTQVYEILGVEDQSLDRFHEVVHPDDRALVDHVTRRLLDQPGPYRVTHRLVRNGEVRTVDQHMQSVPDATGRPVRLLGTMIDVTATRALQQQVQHGQQMRTIGLLAGGMAHDLANALLVMRGHAEVLLTRADLDDEVRASLAAIVRGGEKASTLTRRFMALGRRDELRPTRVDLGDVVEEVLDLAGPAMRSEVALSIEPTEPSPLVLADEHRLRQVLLDLIFNARDAGAQAITLRVSGVELGPGDPRSTDTGLVPGRYGLIDVVDDGTGIDPATMERIFDPFFTTKDADSGSGLGLANAQDFAGQSLGAILVSSVLGSGTTMSLLLPATVAADVPSIPSGRRRARRVLVGASPDRCAELRETLADVDAQLVCMEDLDGLAFSLRTEPIDVAVLDDSMLPASTWPGGLAGVPTIVVTDRGSDYPQATLGVQPGDHAGLRTALGDLLPPSGR
ncbi:MAG TPA: ATP-binding protein [Acidimicrobiales bacterium]|nr:ATP-binding protein [Acidimicrobiales bacterium]